MLAITVQGTQLSSHTESPEGMTPDNWSDPMSRSVVESTG
jgi:hypothetical protein